MVFAEATLTADIRRVCGAYGPAERLYGGEESAAWRVADKVVRIGASTTDPAELAIGAASWCHRVATAARDQGCAEAVTPLQLPGGTGTVTLVGNRVVSLWPYIDGVWPAAADVTTAPAAARLLGRLHRALAGASVGARPKPCFLEPGLDGRASYADPLLHDPRLDAWLAEFSAEAGPRHPLHGDYYRGNLLAARDGSGRLIAVLDWDEAFVGRPEIEVASAVLEFSGEFRFDPVRLRSFTENYIAAGGTAERLDEETLVQLMRHRLRRESVYFVQASARGLAQDEEDLDYHRRRLAAFGQLRP
ncbi:Ser/Thr protein kinase RdoA (MazF antagonist) [Tamaricihabitans halophyticus]|uniref:Ser/Thr protein kinase RdoA (MazF antagonist) n=1 Tax=Tamaricihabitans halophyticus TaxID=1262583 RepID=A0A4R2R031_9PSEU|nr:phosphotransferase [Tamaricihabitans halophyticus]TCP55024.1 Ser/Thr protein kinase RdoA (MazF antagonist) [Tamaricihabitans halophyticus]